MAALGQTLHVTDSAPTYRGRGPIYIKCCWSTFCSDFYPVAAHMSYDCAKSLVARKGDASEERDCIHQSLRMSDFERVNKGGGMRRRDMQSQLGERRQRRSQTGGWSSGRQAQSLQREGRAEAIWGWGGSSHGQTAGHLVATHKQIQSNVLLWQGIG